MNNVQYLRDHRVAPVMNQMVMHLLVERPDNTVAVYACLIEYLEALNQSLASPSSSVRRQSKSPAAGPSSKSSMRSTADNDVSIAA